MLHLTNGDIAAELIRRSGLPGAVLAWRDVLHEGPVPAGLSVERLREVRARFIARRGWGDYHHVLADFARRDAALDAFRGHQEVVLWFEHDLYDQLQLLQVLDRLAGLDAGDARVSVVCIGEHPAVERFLGLGQLEPAHIAALFPGRRPIAAAELCLGRRAWTAFRSPAPTAIAAFLAGADADALPFVAPALARHLEQFPGLHDGLSRTERQILEIVACGARHPREIFLAQRDREEAPFLGDLPFWSCIAELAAGPRPLLTVGGGPAPAPIGPGRYAPWDADVALTADGRAVLECRVDRIAIAGISRWLGGVRLASPPARATPRGPDPLWRWDPARRTVALAAAPA